MTQMNRLNAEFFIQHYEMQRHPEGGYYTETYRSAEKIVGAALPKRFGGDRSVCTQIYFLLVGDEFSSFHRIKSDETWHFYHSAPLELILIHPDGSKEAIILGNSPENGQRFQFTVPQGVWFASRCMESDNCSFAGCTVAPGFDFNDFELANADELSRMFPVHEESIRKYCR